MRFNRSLVVSMLLGLFAVVAGTGPARAVDSRCFEPQFLHIAWPQEGVVVPGAWGTDSRGFNGGAWPFVVSDTGGLIDVFLNVPEDVCSAPALIFRTPTGTTRVLELQPFAGGPEPMAGYFGDLVVWPADIGLWQLTGVRAGTVTMPVGWPRTFWLLHKVAVLLDHLPPAPAGTTISVGGRVSWYTRDSEVLPFAGRRVSVMSTDLAGDDPQPIGTVVTDSRGRFSLPVQVQRTRMIRAEVASSAPYGGDSDASVSYAGSGIQLLSGWQVPVLGGLNTVTGRTVPGRRSVLLETQSPGSEYWQIIGSAVSDDPAGRFTLRYRAGDSSPQLLRIRVAGTPLVDQWEVVAAHRTSLSGRTGGTHTTIIRPGTKMSSFGRLNVTYNSGATGGYANQSVVVQTRSRGVAGALFTTVATARTTSTGYFYANWTARRDVDVRVAYFSPYRTVQWAFAAQGIIDVR